MNTEFELITNFEISYDSEVMKACDPIPFELEPQLDNLYKIANKGKKSGIKRITRLIEKFPRVAVLKDFLSMLYDRMGETKKSFDVLNILAEQHPNYLFGLTNLTADYLHNNKPEKVIDLLGKNFNPKELYPERETFHIDEVIALYKVAVIYFSAKCDFDKANAYLDFIKKEDGFEEDYNFLQILLKEAVMEKRFTEMEDEITVEEKPTILKETDETPSFSIELVEQLYNYDLEIDTEIFDKLLNYDREILIQDLNKVMADSIERYKYFLDLAEDEGYDENKTSFLIHALFLLGELEASESLDNIFEILSQDRDFIEFYINDILTEYLWIALYKVANNKRDKCKVFMQMPGINAFHKAIVSEATMLTAVEQPQYRKEVVNWYRDLFNFFLNSKIEDNVIDSNLMGMMIGDVLEFRGKELLPEIEQLHNKQMVDIFVCGDLETVKSEIKEPIDDYYKKDIIDIYDIYKKMQSWGENNIDFDFHKNQFIENDSKTENIDHEETPVSPIIKTEKKVGRNDPCPCGSGKKYKKCCINK